MMQTPQTHAIVEAAVVLCVRASSPRSPHTMLRHTDYKGKRALNNAGADMLGEFCYKFTSGMQVLLGQSEVVNYVRSKSPGDLAYMRYGGEFKFAGGTRDKGETLEETARRELSEEFTIKVPSDAVLRPFRVNSTRAVQGKSFMMYNYIALADENPWLQNFDVELVNTKLKQKRHAFNDLLTQRRGFWELNKEHRERVSPEVYQVQWFDVVDAMDMYITSKHGDTLIPVNEYQRVAFEKWGVKKRDPMYASMLTLRALELCGSIDGVREAAQEFNTFAEATATQQAITQAFPQDIHTKTKLGHHLLQHNIKGNSKL